MGSSNIKNNTNKYRRKFIFTTIVLVFVLVIFGIDKISNSKEIKNNESNNSGNLLCEVIKNNYSSIMAVKDYQLEYYKKEVTKLTEEKKELSQQNAQFENTVKKFSSIGKLPQSYGLPQQVSRGSDRFTNKKYVGTWLGTFYAPTKEECGNSKGITSSGKPIVPGMTIAVDTKYWKPGTRFYIEGYGEAVADDTGIAIKGKERFDFAVLSTDISKSGSFKARVFLIDD